MNLLVGTYECKVDTKGRLPLPAGLKRQLTEGVEDGYVIKRSVFQQCLEIHPMKNWEKIMNDLSKLNRFVKKNNDFIRVFTAGVKVVELDTNGRLQISKDLVKFANIDKEVVLSTSLNMIEIWDKELYENVINVDDIDFAEMAEGIMGNLNEDE
ncbi:division/cell wall cluster transcriptional repressor MraZ [Faecalibacter rhinopitheci]|uniref:Transcriptional regulator MraZ n=1 Tax=Faecalibacter rhinopitheci TaxID=2779678 RepID=A0A8J7FP36_9FLAO|nr:division/cell wall cluster transcriptional repressor MraZ [Faecalibacter rhinopitheci]MBF0596699.1 division/cell wall cluster transcriptional repressor MraZ [Faecalibacter rhinopitheci]MBQ0147563.1 division/cell wall cluster transcriptional repressor MraZ [Candidatus Onthonaster equi]